MSVFVDRKYLLRVSAKLQRFSRKKEDLYNFRCPLCQDSQKNKIKCRGYVYKKKNDYFYMCHNCGASTNFYNFLNHVDPSLIREYSLENYKERISISGVSDTEEEAPENLKTNPEFKTKLNLPKISELPDGHYAKQYVANRQIPKSMHAYLYFAEDFRDFIESLNIDPTKLAKNDPRLVIPFYDAGKNLICVQGRSLGKSELRYITIKTQEKNDKIFGMDRIDTDERIYVLEGPIDSMFIPNSIATADANLKTAATLFDKSKIVLVFDNEPRNRDIINLMDDAITQHYNIVIWPEMIESKDVNQMILDGFTPEELIDIIEKRTFQNLRAKLEFIKWKKI